MEPEAGIPIHQNQAYDEEQQQLIDPGEGESDTRNEPPIAPPIPSASNVRNVHWWPHWPEWLPVSEQATPFFLSKIADAAVMGLVTHFTFLATYLFAWGPKGSICIPDINEDKKVSNVSWGQGINKDRNVSDLSWVQVFVAYLPFIVLPLALVSKGLAKVAESEKGVVGFVAGLFLFELILAIILGGCMSYCMAELSLLPTLAATIILVLVLIVIWGLSLKYPRFLARRFQIQENSSQTRMRSQLK